MNITSIVLILLALCIGGVTSWFLTRRSANQNAKVQEAAALGMQESIRELEKQVDALQTKNQQLHEEASTTETHHSIQLQETEQRLKDKYEQMLQKIKEENANLDASLKSVSEGKIDAYVQERLQKAEKTAAVVAELEEQLANLKTEHANLLEIHEPLKDNLENAKAQCSSLTKKIKKLEDEIEEAEEEQESLEKKLKAKGAELNEANEQLDKSNSENKRLNSQLEQRENELANRLEELKRKTGSIDFITEILSAPETGASDVKNLYRSINFFESFLRGQFMDCNAHLFDKYPIVNFNGVEFRKGYEAKKEWYLQAFEEWASVKRKSWLDKKTTIAFVGEFSAGKTSIVNRILSQDDPNIPRLPVSTKATTAIPTYIAGGVAETYNFVTPDNKLKAINEETFKKVSKEILDEIKGVSSLIDYFVMTYKNPNLDGLSVLDTPGFNSNDPKDKVRTIDVINECDALFWVFDVNAGTVNRSSIDLIKEKLNKPLIVIINKADTKPVSEVDKVEELIRKTLTEEGLKVEKFIRFSAQAPLSDIMGPIHAIKHDEGRDNFISSVENDLKGMLDTFNNAVNQANQKHNQHGHQVQQITNLYQDGLNSLWRDCNEAASIPHWEKHTFSKDRYEMSASEGYRLIELLKGIATTKSYELANTYNNMMKAVADEHEAYRNLVELKSSWQKINDCMSEFKKATKELK